MRFLEDDIIRLRAVEPADAEFMWNVETDSDQWRENGMSAPYSQANLLDYARNYDADPIRAGQIRLVCELKDTLANGRCGLVDLFDLSALWRTAFTGIYVIPDMRCKGIGARALALLEDYSARLLNLRILAAKISERNAPSLRLFEKSGYTLQGILKDWLLSGDKAFSMHLYAKQL